MLLPFFPTTRQKQPKEDVRTQGISEKWYRTLRTPWASDSTVPRTHLSTEPLNHGVNQFSLFLNPTSVLLSASYNRKNPYWHSRIEFNSMKMFLIIRAASKIKQATSCSPLSSITGGVHAETGQPSVQDAIKRMSTLVGSWKTTFWERFQFRYANTPIKPRRMWKVCRNMHRRI